MTGPKGSKNMKRWKFLAMLPILAMCLTLYAHPAYADSDDPLCLTDVWPSNGAENVKTTVEFTLTFMFNVSDPNLRANNTAAISAEKEDGERVSLTVGYSEMFEDRRKIYVSFSELEYETTYIITVDPLLRAKNGKTLDEPVYIRFTTEKKKEEEIEVPDESVDNDGETDMTNQPEEPDDIYIDPEESVEGEDDITVIARDGGKSGKLYSGSEGDRNVEDEGKGKSESSGKSDDGNGGEGKSIGENTGESISGENKAAGLRKKETGIADDSGTAEIEVENPDKVSDEKPEDLPDESETLPEDPQPQRDDEPEEGQNLPKFTPFEKKEISYMALLFEAVLIGTAAVGGAVRYRKKQK